MFQVSLPLNDLKRMGFGPNFLTLQSGNILAAHVSSAFSGNFSSKKPISSIFILLGQKILGSDPYFLRVRSMLGSDHGPSLG